MYMGWQDTTNRSATNVLRMTATTLARREAVGDVRLVLADSVGGERLLTGIVNSGDRFRAPSSADRLSRLDPQQPVASGRS